MAQHDYVIANGTGAAVRSDLNNALAAIVSQNSGATAPSPTYAYQFWADTTTGLLKLRNAANSAWITLFQLDGEWSTLPVENGTAAAPSIYFKDSGTDTGFYSPGTDQIGISTGGTARLTIDANGNVAVDTNTLYVDAPNNRVGIGTSSVQSQLSVLGPVGTLNDSGGTLLLATDAAGTDVSGALGAGVTFAQRWQPFSGAVRVAGIYGVKGSATSNYGGSLAFYTQPVSGADMGERMRITATGNVGIGTTSPGTRLEVSGADGEFIRINTTTSAGGYMAFRTNTVNMGFIGAGDQLGGGTATDLNVRSQNSLTFCTNGGNERARIDSSGRLLVGTSSSPSAANGSESLFVVQGYVGGSTGNAQISLQRGEAASTITANEGIGNICFADNNGNAFSYITCYADGTAGANDYPGRLTFSVTRDGASSPTESARINNAGFFKATSTGSYQSATGSYHEFVTATNGAEVLTLNHNGTTGNQYGFSILTANNQDNASQWFLYCQGGGVQKAVIRSNGGLANFSANDVNLSDRNVKKDISPATGTWDCIKEWEIVNYRYKDQPDDADLNLGVIAQQVAESCPEVVTVFQEAQDAKPAVLDDDGNEVEAAQEAQPEKLGVKEQQMYWMAIKALQEAQVRIEQLEAKVAALESA